MEDFYSPISEEHKEANFSTVLQKVFYDKKPVKFKYKLYNKKQS